MSKAAKKRKAAERATRSAELVEDSLLDELTPRWEVATGGHKWVDADGERVLTNGVTVFGAEGQSYNPVQVRGLFLEFARTEPTEDGFRGFADRFGLLGFKDTEQLGLLGPLGERWLDWVGAHRRVSLYVQLWEAARKAEGGDRKALANCLSRGVRDAGGTAWTFHQPGNPDDDIARYVLAETDPVAAAMRFVQKVINKGLEGRAGIRVLWHPDRKEYVFRAIPRTLLGCIWWQFARAFTGEIVYGECRVCHKPLERGSGAFMSTREFCSPACKQKDHRARVKRAKELKGRGRTVKQIAKELGTEPDVITHWLTKRK